MAEENQVEMTNQNGEGNSHAQSSETLDATQLQAQLAQIQDALKKANREAAERRKKLEEFEAAETQRKEAQLSEVEKANKRAEEAAARFEALQSAMRDRAIRHAVEIEASRQGFIDPADAIALADMAAVQYSDDDGKVTGADAVVKALAKAKPHLVRTAQNPPANLNGRDGGKAQGGATMDELIARKRGSGMYTPI